MWRVRDRTTFTTFRRGRRARSGLLTVTWVPGTGDATPGRLAFAVGRGVGSAVARNRLRRRLRELARATGLSPGAWLVSASPGAAEASFATLSSWWREALGTLTGSA